MKKGALLLVVLSLLLSCLIGCSGQRDVAKQTQPNGEAPTAPFPTLPEVIDDEGFPRENAESGLKNVEIDYEWTAYYEGTEPPEETNWAEWSDEERRQWLQLYATRCLVTNAEGELFGISTDDDWSNDVTTMKVLGDWGYYNTSQYFVPYSAGYLFAANRDDRPRHYGVKWRGAGYNVDVTGEHLGDVRITVGGVSFSGKAENYDTVNPQNYTVQTQLLNLEENWTRCISVTGTEASDFLLTREGNRYVVLSSHSCQVSLSTGDPSWGTWKTFLNETVPAGTRWYVEDLTAPENELKTGLLP